MTEILPSWVESESVGNAADPLGLQHITDWFSNQLLPGISSTASRARYFSFLCWAYNEHEGDRKKINAWQPIIAEQEKLRRDNMFDGRFDGIIGIKEGSKTKTTLTGSYSQTMVNIGLLKDDKKKLTNYGENLLKAYKNQSPIIKSNKICKNKLISFNLHPNEKNILKELIGMDNRIKGSDNFEKRKQTWCLLAKHKDCKDWDLIKAKYLKKKHKPRNPHEATLWLAVHWSAVVEYLEARFLTIHTNEKIENTSCESANILKKDSNCLEGVRRELEVFIELAQKKRKISEAIYLRHCAAVTNPWIDKNGKPLAGSPKLDKLAATPNFRIRVLYSLAKDLKDAT